MRAKDDDTKLRRFLFIAFAMLRVRIFCIALVTDAAAPPSGDVVRNF